jgi:hypothetical protein
VSSKGLRLNRTDTGGVVRVEAAGVGEIVGGVAAQLGRPGVDGAAKTFYSVRTGQDDRSGAEKARCSAAPTLRSLRLTAGALRIFHLHATRRTPRAIGEVEPLRDDRETVGAAGSEGLV